MAAVTPQDIVELACRVLDAQRGGLALTGPDGPLDTLVAGSPMTPEDVRRLVELRAPANEVWAVGSAVMAVLAVPVRRKNEVLAVLYVATEHRATFDAADERVLSILAEVLAALLDSAEAGRTTRRRSWAAASHGVLLALTAGADPVETLELVAERARSVSGAALAGIARPAVDDAEVLVFDVVAAADLDITALRGLTVPVARTATGATFESGQPVVVRDFGGWVLRRWGDGRPPWAALIEGLDAAVTVPLTVSGERLGVLTVARGRGEPAFTDDEAEHVALYASDAALALRFAQARDDREQVRLLEEQERIARDLHDVVIQRLFAVGLGLMSVGRKLTDPTLAAQVDGFVETIDQSVLELRSSIFGMHRPVRDEATLRAQLVELAHETSEASGLSPRIALDGPIDSAVPESMWPDVLAVAREALANVAHHAGAASVTLTVAVDVAGERLTLDVVDDGTGPPPSQSRTSGLANARERARRWGGTFDFGPGATGGATVRWTVPLVRTRHAEQRGGAQ